MSSVPTVYIEREPLLHMVLAAVEVYNRECFGYVFGFKPRTGRDSYLITSAVNLAAVVRRTNAKIHQSKRGWRRLNDFMKAVPALYRCLGDFHSHPAAGPYQRPFFISEEDARSMSDKDHRLGVILTISRRGTHLLDWRIKSRGTRLRGTLGDFNVHVMVYHVLRKKDGTARRHKSKEPHKPGVPITERLSLHVAPSTLKALNRAQHRQKPV